MFLAYHFFGALRISTLDNFPSLNRDCSFSPASGESSVGVSHTWQRNR